MPAVHQQASIFIRLSNSIRDPGPACTGHAINPAAKPRATASPRTWGPPLVAAPVKVAIGVPVAVLVLDGATTPVPVPCGKLVAGAEVGLMMGDRDVARTMSLRESVPVGFSMSGYVRRVVPSFWTVRARTEVAVAVMV